jgi:hypothetical protein
MTQALLPAGAGGSTATPVPHLQEELAKALSGKGNKYRDVLQVFRLRDYLLFLEGHIDKEPTWASQDLVIGAVIEMQNR